ncbi:MAG: response regulator [Candidatus Nomurabacteria bacterium]|jgi:DNA-binding response OmpR family regulator|nr:response regulator [Candidatus Nomurabacteria bacterium]
MKVLVLEDDKWFADSLYANLERGSEVRICYNPEKVFNIIEKWWPDVLLADVILGAKNLFVLLNEIQSYTDTRVLPIVILSTAAQQIEIEDVAQYNVRKVLDKAEITPSKLCKVLREVIGEWKERA